MKILITGGTGFIGEHVAHACLEKDHEVVLLTSRVQRYKSALPKSLQGTNAVCVSGDVRRIKTIEPAMEGCDAVIISHQFKGFPLERPQDGQTFMEVDARGTENIVKTARKHGVKKLIYLSGAAVHESESEKVPIKAKLMAEEWVRESGIDYTILRVSIVYGPGDHYFDAFWLSQLKERGMTMVIGDGSAKANPVHVEDLAIAVETCLQHPNAENQLFYAGGPDVVSVRETLDLLMNITRLKGRVIYLPNPLLFAAAAVFKLITTRPPITKGLIEFTQFDNTFHGGRNFDEVLELPVRGIEEGLTAAFGKKA
jgi:NADH dehydrogenase